MMTADLPILYSFRRCPYAMRARLALDYAGVRVKLREVVLRSKPAHLLEISPKGTVPVMLLPSGQLIDQSWDIMRWACEQSDPDGYLPPALTDVALGWLARNDGPFKQCLDRYKYPERHPEQTQEAYREQGVAVLLQPMDEQLRQTRFLLGDQPCLMDLALMPFVRQFAQVDADWFAQAPLPALRRWLEDWLKRPAFDRVMQKFEPWAPDHADVYF